MAALVTRNERESEQQSLPAQGESGTRSCVMRSHCEVGDGSMGVAALVGPKLLVETCGAMAHAPPQPRPSRTRITADAIGATLQRLFCMEELTS